VSWAVLTRFAFRKLDTLVDLIAVVQVPYVQVFVNSVRKLCWLQEQLESRDHLVTSFHEDMTSHERLKATRDIFAERRQTRVVLMTGFCAAEPLPYLSRELHVHYDLPRSAEALYSRYGPITRVGPRKLPVYFTTSETLASFQPLMRDFSMLELPYNFADDL
jgi:translation initiation factor 4A